MSVDSNHYLHVFTTSMLPLHQTDFSLYRLYSFRPARLLLPIFSNATLLVLCRYFRKFILQNTLKLHIIPDSYSAIGDVFIQSVHRTLNWKGTFF